MFGFKKNKIKLEKGSSYAVLHGDYVGEIFVYFFEDLLKFYFVSIPKMEIRIVDKSNFQDGIDKEILDFVNILPKDVYSLIEAHGKKLLESK